MTAVEFDVAAHHRLRTKRAEGRATVAEAALECAGRMLWMLAVIVTRDGAECDQRALLDLVGEIVDRTYYRPEPTIRDLLELLHETDPARLTAEAAHAA